MDLQQPCPGGLSVQRKKLRPGDIARTVTTANMHAGPRWASEVTWPVHDNELFFVVSSWSFEKLPICDSDSKTMMCYVIGRISGWMPEVYLERVA